MAIMLRLMKCAIRDVKKTKLKIFFFQSKYSGEQSKKNKKKMKSPKNVAWTISSVFLFFPEKLERNSWSTWINVLTLFCDTLPMTDNFFYTSALSDL